MYKKSFKYKKLLRVSGNGNAHQCALNLLRLQKAFGCNIPVYQGQDVRLVEKVNETDPADWYHGPDAFGGKADVAPSTASIDPNLIEKEKGVLALIRLIKEHENEINLIAIGPLTNLAMAVNLEPDLPKKLQSLTIMGGNQYSIGNTEQYLSEYNFSADPEAAAVTLERYTPHVSTIIILYN